MIITTFGSRFYGGQINSIDLGFIELGHMLGNHLTNLPDIIYANDPQHFDEALLEYYKWDKNSKLIFNTLDLPPHLMDFNTYDLSRYTFINHNWPRNFNPLELKEKLLKADIVTCICKEVRWQLKNYCDIESKVIYNPIKHTSYLNLNNEQKLKNSKGNNYKYLYVGRANDPNKNFKLIYDLMKYRNEPPELLLVIGSENPGWGEWKGIVNDDTLNLAYNSVDFFLFPSIFSSIGLPVLESCVAKTLPICCDDDLCLQEFVYPITLPRDYKIISTAIDDKNWVNNARNWISSKSNEFKERFSSKQIAKNILDLVPELV